MSVYGNDGTEVDLLHDGGPCKGLLDLYYTQLFFHNHNETIQVDIGNE